MSGSPIRTIDSGEQLKYLGSKYSYLGTDRPTSGALGGQLGRVLSAPLKPHQKLNIIITYLLPRYLYILQAPNISAKTLHGCDRLVRSAIRRALHLPQHCANAFIHAPIKSGGLGIVSFATKIPSIIYSRLSAARKVRGDPAIAALTQSQLYLNLLDHSDSE